MDRDTQIRLRILEILEGDYRENPLRGVEISAIEALMEIENVNVEKVIHDLTEEPIDSIISYVEFTQANTCARLTKCGVEYFAKLSTKERYK